MRYNFENIPSICLPEKAKNTVTEELLSNYTYGQKWNITYHTEENCITAGKYEKAEFSEGEYILNVTADGVYLQGCDFSATMRGFMTFLERLKYDESADSFYIEACRITGKPLFPFRAVHLCIFPETKFEFLKKSVRSCAIAKYTHIILEFWGTLKYDCMKELSWPLAFSKAEIKELCKELNALGLEIIPMFNHLGHASNCRGISGKHVVLDQNLKYEYLFEASGAIWNFKREDVYALLGKVRDELIEVCGAGSYFHIGCDEAYALGQNESLAAEVADYINRVSRDLAAKGRRTIIWHDMLLSKTEFEGYKANSNQGVSDILIKNIDKNIIIADWQYYCHDETWITSKKFKDCGFDVLCCPWDNNQNIDEAIATAKENQLQGIIQTTWHTLFRGFTKMIYAGFAAYGSDEDYNSASIARRALPSGGDYEKSGWMEKTIGPGL